MAAGVILVLEDDQEDLELLEQAFVELAVPNERKYYSDGKAFLDYLKTTKEQPFVIISDIRVGATNGLELRNQIQEHPELRKKGIPFVFFSTDARKKIVESAYELTVQGFFEKPDTLQAIVVQLRMIMDYWSMCRHPNSA